MMSGLDGSGAVRTVLTWEAFGGHVPSGGSEMYWFDQSIAIHLFLNLHASGTLKMPPLDANAPSGPLRPLHRPVDMISKYEGRVQGVGCRIQGSGFRV